jgi:hypothetical protein
MNEECSCCGQPKPQEPWVKEYREHNKYCYICGKIGHLLIGKRDYPTNKPEDNHEFRICFNCVVDAVTQFTYKNDKKMPDTNP